jgi:hypothetical protein
MVSVHYPKTVVGEDGEVMRNSGRILSFMQEKEIIDDVKS